MKRIRVGIDTGPLKTGDKFRGIGVYTRELVTFLEKLTEKDNSRFEIKPIDFLGQQSSTFAGYDLIHLTRFNSFRLSVPLKKSPRTKFILTIYDLIPLIYPKNYPPGIKGRLNWEQNRYLIRKNIDRIITISETSKKDICRFIGLKPEKVSVVYLAPRLIFKRLKTDNFKSVIAKSYRLPERFAFYVGDINYNKNIPNLILACRLAGIPLVMAGNKIKDVESLDLDHPELRHLQNLDWSGTTRLGFVPDRDLVKIYNLASIYLQPSFYEGFGLPLLEANACGIPVVASKTQSLVEIAEDAALFADPKSPKDFAEKIKLVLKDRKLKESLVEKGFENAKKYSWDKTACLTLKVYEELLPIE